MRTDVHFRYKIPDEITVLVDTREQIPILFPDSLQIPHPEIPYKQITVFVKQRKIKLDCGDYALQGYQNVCVIERKASQMELWKNLFNPRDKARQAKSFRKLKSSCEFPYILIETSPAELLSNNPKIKCPELVCARLGMAIAKYGLHAIFVPWRSRSSDVRRKLGTLALHLMLGAVLQKTYDVPPMLLD
jgi:ERCC4-type nuclease